MADKQAHHNALKRKQRDELKDVIHTYDEDYCLSDEEKEMTMEERKSFQRDRDYIEEESMCSQLEQLKIFKEENQRLRVLSIQLEKRTQLLKKAKETGNGTEAFNFSYQNSPFDDISEDRETEEKPRKRIHLATASPVWLRRNKYALSHASRTPNRRSKSLNKYSWDNMPSTVENRPSAVQPLCFETDKICFDFKNLPSIVETIKLEDCLTPVIQKSN